MVACISKLESTVLQLKITCKCRDKLGNVSCALIRVHVHVDLRGNRHSFVGLTLDSLELWMVNSAGSVASCFQH